MDEAKIAILEMLPAAYYDLMSTSPAQRPGVFETYLAEAYLKGKTDALTPEEVQAVVDLRTKDMEL